MLRPGVQIAPNVAFSVQKQKGNIVLSISKMYCVENRCDWEVLFVDVEILSALSVNIICFDY